MKTGTGMTYENFALLLVLVYNNYIMAKRMAVNTKNKASRSKKTQKRLVAKNARLAVHKAKKFGKSGKK